MLSMYVNRTKLKKLDQAIRTGTSGLLLGESRSQNTKGSRLNISLCCTSVSMMLISRDSK